MRLYSLPIISGKKKAHCVIVLEIAGVRSRPVLLLHGLRSEWWINAGQRVDDGGGTAQRCGLSRYF